MSTTKYMNSMPMTFMPAMDGHIVRKSQRYEMANKKVRSIPTNLQSPTENWNVRTPAHTWIVRTRCMARWGQQVSRNPQRRIVSHHLSSGESAFTFAAFLSGPRYGIRVREPNRPHPPYWTSCHPSTTSNWQVRGSDFRGTPLSS